MQEESKISGCQHLTTSRLRLQQNQDHSVILSTFFHKRIHVCLCCYESDWHELEFIRRRVSKQDDSDPDLISYGALSHSEPSNRPLDVQ